MSQPTRTTSADSGPDLTPVEAAILQLSRSLAVAVALLEQQQKTLAILESVVSQAAEDVRAFAAAAECGLLRADG